MIRASYSIHTGDTSSPAVEGVFRIAGLMRHTPWSITAVPPPPEDEDARETFIHTLTFEQG